MIRRLIEDIRGTSAIEYAIVASLISVAGIGAFMALGDSSREQFSTVQTAYRDAR